MDRWGHIRVFSSDYRAWLDGCCAVDRQNVPLGNRGRGSVFTITYLSAVHSVVTKGDRGGKWRGDGEEMDLSRTAVEFVPSVYAYRRLQQRGEADWNAVLMHHFRQGATCAGHYGAK